jgi:hypothetical protein
MTPRHAVLIHPIRDAADHDAAVARSWALRHADPGTPEHAENLVLLDLIEAYERRAGAELPRFTAWRCWPT